MSPTTLQPAPVDYGSGFSGARAARAENF